jgi:hypothetical protein
LAAGGRRRVPGNFNVDAGAAGTSLAAIPPAYAAPHYTRYVGGEVGSIIFKTRFTNSKKEKSMLERCLLLMTGQSLIGRLSEADQWLKWKEQELPARMPMLLTTDIH